MRKKTKIIIVVAAALLIIAIVYFVFIRKPKVGTFEQEIKNVNGSTPVQLNTPSTPTANDSLPLKIGSKGQRVTNVQNAVNKINPLAQLKVDGDFGTATRNALITFVGSEYYPIDSSLYLKLMQKAAAIK